MKAENKPAIQKPDLSNSNIEDESADEGVRQQIQQRDLLKVFF